MPFFAFLLPFLRSISPRAILIGAGVVAVVGVLAYARHTGYEKCRAEHLAANLNQLEKFNEIAARRPDTDALIDSLLNGRF